MSRSGTRARCPICNFDCDSRVLLGRPDYEYGVKTELAYWRCGDPRCRHVFASPLPSDATILQFYAQYSTHSDDALLQPLSPTSRKLAAWQHSAMLRNLQRDHGMAARCLDYGCGNGGFLQAAREFGFRSVIGFDADPEAREAAMARGGRVFDTESSALEQGPFDVIVLNHVIEHLRNPGDTLRRLSAALAPKGTIRLWTPNAESGLARQYGDRWRGWETPRHLHVFTAGSLQGMALALNDVGVHPVCLASTNRKFLGMYHASKDPEPAGRSRVRRWWRHGRSLTAWLRAEVFRRIAGWNRRLGGEELVLVLQRHP